MTDGKKPARYACHRNGVMVESESGEYVEYADLIAAQKELEAAHRDIDEAVLRAAELERGMENADVQLQKAEQALALRGEPVAWKLVPLEATDEMIDAAQACDQEGQDDVLAAWKHLYRIMIDAAPLYAAPISGERAPFQLRVEPWMQACFGEEIANDKTERNHRFVEESLELAQACGCTASEAHQLVDYVFGRPTGERVQEVGGVMVTLAALCLAHGLDMHGAGETELERIWQKIDKIRAKQAAKPKHSPLPEAAAVSGERVREACAKVPLEPTQEMLEAMSKAMHDNMILMNFGPRNGMMKMLPKLYKAMLNALPLTAIKGDTNE